MSSSKILRSVHGKFFLVGEYLALVGGPAIVGLTQEKFSLVQSTAGRKIPPESPAGKLIQKKEGSKKQLSEKFTQWSLESTAETLSRGGFGASTAEFVLSWLELNEIPKTKFGDQWKKIHSDYLKFAARPKAITPSGVDLIAQAAGKSILWINSKKGFADMTQAMSKMPVRIFAIKRTKGVLKTLTHEHLQKWSSTEEFETKFKTTIEDLQDIVTLASIAVNRGDAQAIGSALTQYAECLREVGLEASEVTVERAILSTLPGVLGAKGLGAAQTDGFAVALDPQIYADGSASIKLIKIMHEFKARTGAELEEVAILEPGSEA